MVKLESLFVSSHLYRSEFVVVKIEDREVGTAGEVGYLGDALESQY